MATETYQLTIEGVDQASYRSTNLHFKGVGAATGDTVAGAESLIAGFIAAAETAWLNTLPASYTLMLYSARRVNPPSSATRTTAFGYGSKQGNRGSNAIGQQTCPSVFLVPTMGVKSGGKIFWPAIAAGDIAQSTYNAAWVTAVNTWMGIVRTGFTNAGITWTLAIYSRKTASASDVANFSFSPLIGFISRRRRPAGAVG